MIRCFTWPKCFNNLFIQQMLCWVKNTSIFIQEKGMTILNNISFHVIPLVHHSIFNAEFFHNGGSMSVIAPHSPIIFSDYGFHDIFEAEYKRRESRKWPQHINEILQNNLLNKKHVSLKILTLKMMCLKWTGLANKNIILASVMFVEVWNFCMAQMRNTTFSATPRARLYSYMTVDYYMVEVHLENWESM